MTFKEWLLELTDTGWPDKENPEALATAMPGIITPKEDPPKPVATATEKYAVGRKRCRKK